MSIATHVVVFASLLPAVGAGPHPQFEAVGKRFAGVHPGRFEGEVCLITGATSGLGEHAAYHLAMEGCAVVITGRREKNGEHVRKNIDSLEGTSTLKPKALFIKADVTKPEEMDKAYAQVNETYGRLDAVFANAGINTLTDFAGTTGLVPPSDQISIAKQVVDVNVMGVYYTVRSAVPMLRQVGALKKEPRGKIVLCSSTCGLTACTGEVSALYIAAKHALEGMKKALVQEVGADGSTIRINNVNPSFTPSEMSDPFYALASGKTFIDSVSPGNRMAE